jgi:Fur family ferric uptake transcriptional regulator
MDHCAHETTLRTVGLRRTKDRHDLLSLFEASRAWTAGELHASLPSMDLSTVYRNVQRLVETGVLAEAHVHGKEAYYERADRAHHDHLLCARCEAASCVPCPVASLSTPHSLELYGTCDSCTA